MDKFEEWFASQDFYTNMLFIHGDGLFVKDGDVYRVLPVQMTWEVWQSRQAEVDQLNKVLDERTKEWLEAIKLGTYFQEAAKPLKDEVEQLNKTLSIKSKFLDDSDAANKFLSEQLEDKNKRIAELELALTQIKSWESHPKNYGIDFGSWGLRDFYRDLADKALRGEHE